MGHTPGPWRMRVAYSNGEPNGAVVYSGARHVADCQDGLTQEECEENARLIAAAPDLLAACEAALTALTHLAAHGTLPPDMRLRDLPVLPLVAAIVKARGEEK